jgi:hypothetical protein
MRKKQLLTTTCLVFASVILLFDASAQKLPSPFVILPEPQTIILSSESGLDAGKLKYLRLQGDFNRPVMENILSQLTIGKSKGIGTLTLILDSALNSLPSEEGYILTISNTEAEIAAKGEAGLFYGCQSLEQLLEDARDFEKPVPSCKIIDYPVLSYRAVHFDVKHHLDHMNYYYESIDRLARYKINAVVFEFEDKLRYQRQALVGAPQSISIDEMAALTKYAMDRHIEITPLVQGLGHATFILKHQEYAHLREIPWNRWAFCPLNEGTYQVLFDLYRDAIAATPGSRYLHIGGDEIGNIGLCPRCKPTAEKEGMMSLNLYWLKRVCEFAEENNRIPIFWDDMPLKIAGLLESTDSYDMPLPIVEQFWKNGIPLLDSLLSDFPKNCVFMRWNYSMARQPGNINALDWYKSRGLKAMIATATNTNGGLLFQEDERDQGVNSSGISTIRSFIQLAAEKNINGALCTAWDDKSPHMENYWRGFIAAAEYCWSPKGRSLEEFDYAWLQREFGLSVPGYLSFNDKLRKGSVLWYEGFFRNGSFLSDENALQSLVQLEHWLAPLEGQEKKQFDYSSKLIDLPDLNSPGTWSLKYKDRLEKALLEYNNYKNLSGKLVELYNSSSRNNYYWKLSLALYNFQFTTPKILLALKEADNPDKKKQQKGLEGVKKAMKEFDGVWQELQLIYSQTRFISFPVNYVPDRYFHLASQREDMSWMTQVDELFFEKINKWMDNLPEKTP